MTSGVIHTVTPDGVNTIPTLLDPRRRSWNCGVVRDVLRSCRFYDTIDAGAN